MGIMDFFRKKSSEQQVEQVVDPVEASKKVFVSDISMFELEGTNWTEFGSVLKRNAILPNSYPKKPDDVVVGLGKDNRPYASLTFNSTTSSSVRKYLLLQDGVYEYVNDAIDDGKNVKLNNVWNDFQNTIRIKTKFNNNYQIGLHVNHGKEMKCRAEQLLAFEDFFERENDFLEEHSNDTYIAFGIANYKNPIFINGINIGGVDIGGGSAEPFSPKTLEFCVSKLTEEAKANEGFDIEYFRKKCDMIRSKSVYNTDDWDKVINKTSEIVTKAYALSNEENELI